MSRDSEIAATVYVVSGWADDNFDLVGVYRDKSEAERVCAEREANKTDKWMEYDVQETELHG